MPHDNMMSNHASSDNEVKPPRTFTARSHDLTIDLLRTATYIKRSTFFASALSALPPHGESKVVEVPDVDAETFKYYLHCVNTGYAKWKKFNSKPKRGLLSPELRAAKIDSTILQYCKGYYFATKLGDCEAANLIIDALIEYTVKKDSLFPEAQVQRIYNDTETPWPLRKLAVDLWAYAAKHAVTAQRDLGPLPKAFLIDVLKEKIKAEADGAETVVRQTFDHGVISREKERYHCYNELHPRP